VRVAVDRKHTAVPLLSESITFPEPIEPRSKSRFEMFR
jgi:hypothetical protein